MRTARTRYFHVILFVLFCTLAAQGAVRASDADLVLYNGKIVTVDGEFSLAQAMAVQDGRIVAVGGNDDVLRLEGNET